MNINFPAQSTVTIHPYFLLHCFVHCYKIYLNKATTNKVYEGRKRSIF